MRFRLLLAGLLSILALPAVRAVAAGPDAALRVLPVDPQSRVPERRAVLTPFEG